MFDELVSPRLDVIPMDEETGDVSQCVLPALFLEFTAPEMDMSSRRLTEAP
ncbi:hypothetical protein BJV82DRAFT_666785 [Fennellomyces sp. T-0311]|nr:hypothetical protein BJV82DRAFT_666785 [Fennellomyces sp. T-0311]